MIKIKNIFIIFFISILSLVKAQADINQQQVNSAQAVFQRKKEVLPAVKQDDPSNRGDS